CQLGNGPGSDGTFHAALSAGYRVRGHLNSTKSREANGLRTLPACSSKTARCPPAAKVTRQRSGPPKLSRRPASSNRNKDQAPVLVIVTVSGFGSEGLTSADLVSPGLGSAGLISDLGSKVTLDWRTPVGPGHCATIGRDALPS